MKKTFLAALMLTASFQVTAQCKTIVTQFGKVKIVCKAGGHCRLMIDPVTGKTKVICH